MAGTCVTGPVLKLVQNLNIICGASNNSRGLNVIRF